MLLDGFVCLAEAGVEQLVVKYIRHGRSGSYYSGIQISMLRTAMTTALQQTRRGAEAPEPTQQRQQQQTRQGAKAREPSSPAYPRMVTGAANTNGTTRTGCGRCLTPFAMISSSTAIITAGSGRPRSRQIHRLVYSLLLWTVGILGGEAGDRPPGHTDAVWDMLVYIRDTTRHGAGATRQLHLVTVTLWSSSGTVLNVYTWWHDGWLVRTMYIDGPDGSDQIAVTIESVAELTLADGSVRAN